MTAGAELARLIRGRLTRAAAVAARLCELAKRTPERVLASDAALTRADEGERARWRLGEEVELRGPAA